MDGTAGETRQPEEEQAMTCRSSRAACSRSSSNKVTESFVIRLNTDGDRTNQGGSSHIRLGSRNNPSKQCREDCFRSSMNNFSEPWKSSGSNSSNHNNKTNLEYSSLSSTSSTKNTANSRHSNPRWRPSVHLGPARPSLSSPITALLAAILVTSLVLLPVGVMADWDTNCPSTCKCTYVSNRKVAKCEGAGYTTVPSTLSPEIQELVLANNNILQIDRNEFQKAGLVNLQRLDLSNNQISFIDKDAFSGLRILIELDLQGNQVDKLHPLTFTGMEKLRKLDLSGNSLERLEAHQFPPLHHLQTLKLDSCKLSYVHNYAFSNLPNVTSIGLSYNSLESLQAALFASNSRLVSLELSNNRWNCDCNMRQFASWMAHSEIFRKTNWNCFSPSRLKDAHWDDIPLDDYACGPTVEVAQEIVSVVVGDHSSLNCWANGDPLPAIQWMAEKRVLSNMTTIGSSTDHYAVHTVENSTGVYSTLELGIYGDHHPSAYTCQASNVANSVEKTIKVVVGTGDTLDVIDKAGPNMFILIGIGVALIVLVILLIVLIVCCWCRRRPSSLTPHSKLNGSAGEHGNVMVVAPSSSINPVGKPPRQYEKLPQKDIEMTHLVSSSMDGGAHKSFEELNYPANHQSNYVEQPRSRLPPLQEEGISGHLPSSPYLVHDSAPSPTLTLQSNITQTTGSHFPDLLDNARVPRTISPTQMSYQSLAYPPLGTDWRFSYAHPSDYGSGQPSEYARSPVAYSTPQHQRPGYVTLPRRPRAPSWSGVPSPNPHIVANPLLSPSVPPSETIYDTLGPRTTADGTSTTDLTRPGSRAALYEPLPPGGAMPPTSPVGLAAHYNSMAANKYNSPRHGNYQGQARPGTSQTLPRSTPNLLDDSSLSIPQYRPSRNTSIDPYSTQLQPMQTSEIEPLIEDPALGIPYDPSYLYDPSNTAAAEEVSNLTMNGGAGYNSTNATNNNNSKNNYNNVKSSSNNNSINNKSLQQRQQETLNRNLRSASPSLSPSDKSSNKTLNSSMSPGTPSPVPTPTQILSSASPHNNKQGSLARPSPSSTPNNNPVVSNGYPASPSSPSFPSNGLDASAAGLPSPSSVGINGGGVLKKKVPPRPPPKPASKRLSVASVTSDSGAAGAPRKASVTSSSGGALFQDEGPDGSEV